MKSPYLLIAGNIGTGKTTLAETLSAKLSATHYPEPFEHNPFLDAFYAQPVSYAFRSQLSFLLEHFRHHQTIDAGSCRAVKDGSLFDSAEVVTKVLYQENLLTQLDWNLYNQVYSALRALCATPALVIVLKGEPNSLLDRIRQRGRAFEQGITISYLERLNQEYDEWVLKWSASEIVSIDTEDLTLDEVAKRALVFAEPLFATRRA